MASDTQTTVGERTVTAFFDTAGAARTAVDDLVAAGVERDHISQTGGQDAAAQAAVEKPHLGFWESLKDFFLPDADRDIYAEGLRRGGFLLQVRTDRDNYDRVLDILDTDGAINMDEREAGWRTEGWTGSLGQPGTVAMATGPAGGVIPVAGLMSEAGDATPRTVENARATDRAGTAESAHVLDSLDANEAVRRTETASFGNDTTADPLNPRGPAGSADDARHARDSLSADEVVRRTDDVALGGTSGITGGAASTEPAHVRDSFSAEETVRRMDAATFGDAATGGSSGARDGASAMGDDALGRAGVLDSAGPAAASAADAPSYRRDTSHGRARLRGYVLEGGQEAGEAAEGSFSPDRDRDRIVEHMEVYSADGQSIGTVDHLDGPDRIKLARSTSPDGQHHMVPFTWIDHVDQHVHLRKTLAEIKAQQ